jgi:xanthine/CO dehydrogenase XdhC/CoxF family maturation factor
MHPAQRLLIDPRFDQPSVALRRGAPASQRTDETGIAAQRGKQRRLVELGVVAEDDHRVALSQGSEAPRLLRYGVSDELALTAGLMCGGSVEVLVHELRDRSRASTITTR